MIVTHKIKIELLRPGISPTVSVMQADENSRVLEITLNANGSAWEIPDGVSFSIAYKKPDGTKGLYDTLPNGSNAFTVAGNTVSVVIAPQMLTVPGTVTASVVISDGEHRVNTFPIIVNVIQNPAVGAVESEDYYYSSVIGNLEDLKTENKSSLVAAINEIFSTGGSGSDSGQNVELDSSLTQSGKAADAKATGDEIKRVEGKIPSIEGLAKTEDIPKVPIWAMQSSKPAYTASEVGALPNTYTPPNQTAEQVGADSKGTAAAAVSGHNTATDSHGDIRQELAAINARLTAFFDSDNQTLDELSEIVAYITSNKSLIDAITTSKVSVADIVNNLSTNAANKPLSAAQGVALKALIDAITIPTKLSQLTNDKGYITGYTETDPTVPAWAKASSKPSYSKSEVGLGNVDNVKQYSASNPPPYPVTSVNGKTGVVTIAVPTVPTKVSAFTNDAGYLTKHQDISGKVDKDKLTLGRDASGLLYLYIDGLPAGAGIELPTGGIDGYITEDKQIIFNNLPDGEYALAYIAEDGSIVPIGALEKDTNVYYTVKNTLTNCTSNNSATQAVQGGSYSATITAKSGYEMSSIKVTMGGSDISSSAVSGGKITIANVTGNIVITATATEKAKEPTNFAEPNSTNKTDWSIWINNARAGSDGAYRSDTYNEGYGTPAVSNYIAVQNGDIVEFTGIYTKGKNTVVYGSTQNVLKTATLTSQTTHLSGIALSSDEWDGQFTVNNSNVAFIRLGGYVKPESRDIFIKIKRNGEYL